LRRRGPPPGEPLKGEAKGTIQELTIGVPHGFAGGADCKPSIASRSGSMLPNASSC
jgi:hypothetical protein